VIPLLLGGRQLAVFRTTSFAFILLPILAGTVYALPFATLVLRNRGKRRQDSALSFAVVIAASVTGTTTGLLRSEVLSQGANLWYEANIAATVLFGVVLIAIAHRLLRSALRRGRAMMVVVVTTGLAGFSTISYVLLPVALLLLVAAYFAIPFAYGDTTV